MCIMIMCAISGMSSRNIMEKRVEGRVGPPASCEGDGFSGTTFDFSLAEAIHFCINIYLALDRGSVHGL